MSQNLQVSKKEKGNNVETPPTSKSDVKSNESRGESPTCAFKGNYTKYSEKIFSNKDEMRSFVEASSNSYQFECKFCKKFFGEDFSPINVKTLKLHIRSDKHELATPKEKYKKELEIL